MIDIICASAVSASQLISCNICVLMSVYYSLSLSLFFFLTDLGLDQFIAKRYDGKVRSGHLCGKADSHFRRSAGGSLNNYVFAINDRLHKYILNYDFSRNMCYNNSKSLMIFINFL